jgi:hypothetical protein
VNNSYQSLVKEIFHTLSLVGQTYDPNGDKEKEQLNNHILHLGRLLCYTFIFRANILEENMHHFYGQLKRHSGSCLDVYLKQARGMYEYHLSSYVNSVIRRPLGKLLVIYGMAFNPMYLRL